MVSVQSILIRFEVDPCTCDRSVQDRIRRNVSDLDCVINNSALNCSTGSNVVVLFADHK